MANVMELKAVKETFNFTERELELCCMVANRFANKDLFSAGHCVTNFINGRPNLDKDITDFLNEVT
jgi:hypothetical protein